MDLVDTKVKGNIIETEVSDNGKAPKREVYEGIQGRSSQVNNRRGAILSGSRTPIAVSAHYAHELGKGF